jgi:tetratricopeptide (TPR) repeat protein
MGVPIEIHWSWLLFALALGLLVHGLDILVASWVVLATVAVLVHEAGHAVVVRAYGGAPRVVLHGSGAMTISPYLGARRHVVLAAAGPLSGALLGCIVLAVAWSLPPGAIPQPVLDDVVLVTFGWSAFNLLPLAGLDGRTVLDSLVSVTLGRPEPAVGRVVGGFLVLSLLLATALAGQYVATFLIAFVVLATIVPLGSVSRLFGTGGSAVGGPGLLVVGRAADALAWSDAELERDPAQVEAALVRGDALRQLTRWAEAEAVYDGVLGRHPGSARALAGRSITRRAVGRLDEARADLARLVVAAGDDVDAVGPAVAALYADDRFDDAARVLDHAVARPDLAPPTRELLLVLQAMVGIALGQAELALPAIERRLSVSPDDFAAHELRAYALVQLGRLREARDSARRAVAGAPLHPELLETLAVTERLTGDPDTALGHMLDAATARPYLPRARAELSACFTQLGRIEEATGALDGLPAWTSADPHVTYARACLLASAGRTSEAAAAIGAATRIRPALGRLARWDPNLRDAIDTHQPAGFVTAAAEESAERRT